MIWDDFDLQFVGHKSSIPRTIVLGTCQTVYIDTGDIPGRLICYLSDKIIFLAFRYIFLLEIITFIRTHFLYII